VLPLSSVAKFNRTVGPVTVNHSGQIPSVTISFNLASGVSLGTAVKAVESESAKILPPTISASFAGIAAAFMTTQQGLLVLLVLAVFVIYVILGVLYESFIHPITILSGLPSAVFGALLTLKLFHRELDLYAFVGIIMLFGVVKKNAIMMIDFAIDARRQGSDAFDAIWRGALLRFRPIMMTTVAALFGTLPIALGYGEGADARQPLGLAVVGGLVLSQFLTLYITPVIYLYLDKVQSGFREKPVVRERQIVLAADERR